MTVNELQTIAQRLTQKGLTISLAESCTGGLVSKLLTDLPGSSAYYKYGVVAYSNEAKVRLLGVKEETLAAYGAVSSETAAEMSQGIRSIGNTSIGIGITGIAGPDSDNTLKPVGLIYISLSADGFLDTREFRTSFVGDVRSSNRNFAADAALKMLAEYLNRLS
ncbi:MAG: CinA family protein [Acutalibacteraceae bacterium]|jgi:PncC family amidohydrolase